MGLSFHLRSSAECSTCKAMRLKSNALAEQMRRLKLAASPASRCFLVALFLFGFISSYFGDLRSKTDPQHAGNADVEKHPSKSAIVFVHAGRDPRISRSIQIRR